MFKGAHTALVTPFRNHEFDEPAFRKLIENQFDNGISGVVPCGTTGESPTLSHSEHQRVIEVAIEASSGRGLVIAGDQVVISRAQKVVDLKVVAHAQKVVSLRVASHAQIASQVKSQLKKVSLKNINTIWGCLVSTRHLEIVMHTEVDRWTRKTRSCYNCKSYR